MYNFTENEWDHFCNIYIDQETHNAPSHQTRTGTASYIKHPKLKLLLKYLPTTTGNTTDWSNCRRKFVVTLTANGHQHVIDKIFRLPDAIGDPIKYSKYKTGNYSVFSVLDPNFVESNLHGRMNNYRLVDDVRDIFVDIDS